MPGRIYRKLRTSSGFFNRYMSRDLSHLIPEKVHLVEMYM